MNYDDFKDLRYDLESILYGDMNDREKMQALSRLGTFEGGVLERIISVHELEAFGWLDKAPGSMVSDLGSSWSDISSPGYVEFYPSSKSEFSVEVRFVVANGHGFKIPYFDEDLMEGDEEKAYEMQEDELYWMLMDTCNTSIELYTEGEVIVDPDAVYEVISTRYDEDKNEVIVMLRGLY